MLTVTLDVEGRYILATRCMGFSNPPTLSQFRREKNGVRETTEILLSYILGLMLESFYRLIFNKGRFIYQAPLIRPGSGVCCYDVGEA